MSGADCELQMLVVVVPCPWLSVSNLKADRRKGVTGRLQKIGRLAAKTCFSYGTLGHKLGHVDTVDGSEIRRSPPGMCKTS